MHDLCDVRVERAGCDQTGERGERRFGLRHLVVAAAEFGRRRRIHSSDEPGLVRGERGDGVQGLAADQVEDGVHAVRGEGGNPVGHAISVGDVGGPERGDQLRPAQTRRADHGGALGTGDLHRGRRRPSPAWCHRV